MYTGRVSTGPRPGGSIARLLVELANDPALLEEFRNDPPGVMSRYGLTEGQQAIVGSGDLAAIRAAIDYEYAAGSAEGVLPTWGFDSEEGVAMAVTWRPRPPQPPTWVRPPEAAPTWTYDSPPESE